MKLRKLELKDAPFMLEWMHDDDVTANMQKEFNKMTLEDCQKFISNSQNDEKNIHFAIADDMDTYMGTVSLKNIKFDTAEFAITVRKVAMGKGYSKFGMNKILEYGLENLKLHYIYWCVSKENRRAIRFYDKNKYERVEPDKLNPECLKEYSNEQIKDFLWYRKNNTFARY